MNVSVKFLLDTSKSVTHAFEIHPCGRHVYSLLRLNTSHHPASIAIGAASANSAKFRGIRRRMYIEDLLR